MITTGFRRLRLPFLVLVASEVIVLASLVIVADSSLLRVGLAALMVATLAVLAVRGPQYTVLLTLALLPLLGLFRRLLIPVAGWSSWDALLVVAPVVSVILAFRLFVLERRPLASDFLSKMVAIILLLTLLESLNPTGGSLVAGLTGLLFAAAPLAWFFIGRELGDRRLATTILATAVVLGLAIAFYGLWQTTAGLPSWDAAWVDLSGYTSLSVQGTIRAMGTFASSAEYATFLGAAFVVAWAAVLHGRIIAVLALPVLAYAVFLDSSRTIVVLVLLGVAVVTGMRTGSLFLTLFSISFAALAAVGIIAFFGASLADSAAQSGNPLITHQAAGLLNPFDPKQSTLQKHQSLITTGVADSLSYPFGRGLAATNPQAKRFAATVAGTEVDFSNAFVALGPLGGVIFLLVILLTLWETARLAYSAKQFVHLALVGLLVATLGQWLNGGYYALAPLVWFLVGWANRDWVKRRATLASAAKPVDTSRLPAVKWPSSAVGSVISPPAAQGWKVR